MISIRRKLMAKQSEDTPTDLLANVEWIEGYFIDNSGNIGANASGRITDYVKVRPNTTYILQGHATGSPIYDRVHSYNAEKTWTAMIARFDWLYQDFTSQFTTPSQCQYIRLSTEIYTEVHMYLA